MDRIIFLLDSTGLKDGNKNHHTFQSCCVLYEESSFLSLNSSSRASSEILKAYVSCSSSIQSWSLFTDTLVHGSLKAKDVCFEKEWDPANRLHFLLQASPLERGAAAQEEHPAGGTGNTAQRTSVPSLLGLEPCQAFCSEECGQPAQDGPGVL